VPVEAVVGAAALEVAAEAEAEVEVEVEVVVAVVIANTQVSATSSRPLVSACR
jgi:hypothetical protein